MITYRFNTIQQAKTFYKQLSEFCDCPVVRVNLDANDVEVEVLDDRASELVSRAVWDTILKTQILPVATF